jgi:DNA polymerase III subunit delta
MVRDPVPAEIEKEIKQGCLAPFYLLHGANEFILEKTLERLKGTLPESARPFNLEVFYGGECEPSDVMSRARSVPFLARNRLIIVRRCDAFGVEALDQFLAYLKSPVESTCLVFVCTKADFRRELFRTLRALGRAVHFEELREHQVPQWIARTAVELGLRMDAESASYLQQVAGNDPRDLCGELEKIRIRYGEGSVGLEKFKGMVSQHRSFTIFELVAVVSKRDSGAALVALSRFLEEEDKRGGPLRLLGMLNRQFRLLLQTREVLDNGGKKREVEELLGQARHSAGEFTAQARGWSIDELREALALLYEADGRMKTGSSPRLVIENVLLRLCSRSSRRGGDLVHLAGEA